MANNFEAPESRNEAILQNILGADNTLLPPQSRIEVLLQLLLEELEGGGGGGGSVVVDNAFSTTSKNPVENKVITASVLPAIAGIVPNANGSMELYSKDLNTIISSGFYNAMTCQNAPVEYCTLIVCGYYLAGYCTQIATDVTTGNIYIRSQVNGTWGAWKMFDVARAIAQSDWSESDNTSEAFILNKPEIQTQGNWTYKINSDNTFNAWYKATKQTVVITNQSGNLYRSELASLALPSDLYDNYTCDIIDATIDVSHNNYPCWAVLGDFYATGINYYAISGNSRSSTPNYRITAQVFGTLS